MPKRRKGWTRGSTPQGTHFAYVQAGHESADDITAAAAEMATQIRTRQSDGVEADDWVALILRMPEGLRNVLLDQLDRGNLLRSISTGWPHPDSIVALFRDCFDVAAQDLPPGVLLEIVNDPRQWRENISEKKDGQEHMLMA